MIGKKRSSAHVTLIASGTSVHGDIEFSGAIQIEGKVKGSLRALNNDRASVMVIAGGEIVGDVSAPEVMVNGYVQGNIYASERVELAPEARIEGDVHYKVLEMIGGAQINGALVHEEHIATLPSPENAQNNEDV